MRHKTKIKEDRTMARPIRETPILYGEDARRFEENMKRVERMSPEQRRTNREKLHEEAEKIRKEWNLTFVY